MQYSNYIPRIISRFKFRQIIIDELNMVCKDLNNKPNFNRISSKITLNSWNVIGSTLLDIVNKSITIESFPDN